MCKQILAITDMSTIDNILILVLQVETGLIIGAWNLPVQLLDLLCFINHLHDKILGIISFLDILYQMADIEGRAAKSLFCSEKTIRRTLKIDKKVLLRR